MILHTYIYETLCHIPTILNYKNCFHYIADVISYSKYNNHNKKEGAAPYRIN